MRVAVKLKTVLVEVLAVDEDHDARLRIVSEAPYSFSINSHTTDDFRGSIGPKESPGHPLQEPGLVNLLAHRARP